ncbi:DoxX family protein [Cytophagaceae bacterium YF14B1]|uniref:DoxX family protein n=1 Tax=Xanthocytophaga flava TaxID=3048013 RepID=A0AAE3UBE6_9BACT|nr:DoxX family protein [Xanthocytophaga flavus]MDJ1484308.1 DoxX family protein [Xanthocytophaga flavus]
MTAKTKNIIGWSLSGLLAVLLIASAIDKILSTQHAIEMASGFGISAKQYMLLGIIEIVSVILFLYPKTGILGLLLLSSYLGGAIATHLQHNQDIVFPAVLEAIAWLSAVIRYPELTQGLVNKIAEKN